MQRSGINTWKPFKVLSLLAVSAGILISCGTNAPEENYLARVNNTYLTTDDLEVLSRLSPDGTIPEGQLESFVNSWIETELLAQQSLKYNLDENPDLQSRLESYRKKLLADMYIRHHIYRNVTVSEADIREYYQENKQLFMRENDAADVTHYFSANEDTAMQVYDILRNGSPEEKQLLYERNRPETKIITRNDVIPEIGNTVFGTQAMGVLNPIESDRGFHIIRVKQRFKAGSYKPVNMVRDEIRERLLISSQKDHYYQVLDSLKGVVDFEINKERYNEISGKRSVKTIP